jgi:hypothetical protein
VDGRAIFGCAMKMDLLHGSTMLEEVRFSYLVIHRRSHVDANRLGEEGEVEVGIPTKGRLAFKPSLTRKTMTCDVIGAKVGPRRGGC